MGPQRAVPSSLRKIHAEYQQILTMFYEKDMNVYLGVVILNPTQKESEDGAQSKIIVDTVTVLAKDSGQATAKVLKKVPDEYEGQDERFEVRLILFPKSV